MDDEELYERNHNKPFEQEYICRASGEKCARASKHFTEYAQFIKRLSESDDDRIFLQVERNLCIDDKVCPIWKLWKETQKVK